MNKAENKESQIKNLIETFDNLNEENEDSNKKYKIIFQNKTKNDEIGLNIKKINKLNINKNMEENNNNIFIIKSNEDIQAMAYSKNIMNTEIKKINILYKNKKSSSYDKYSPKKIKNLKKNSTLRRISSQNLNQLINLNNYNDINTQKKKMENNSSVKLSSLELNGNTQIIASTQVRKLSNSSFNFGFINKEESPKYNTNINSVLNLNIGNNIDSLISKINLLEIKNASNESNEEEENYYNNNIYNQYQPEIIVRTNQLDSIEEEAYEEEYEYKTKTKSDSNIKNENINKHKINYLNSYEKEIKNNNMASISTKFGTGKNNNIFDISSDEDEECDKNYKIIDINNDESDNNFIIKPIKLNENDYSVSFINESNDNKLFFSPNKTRLNKIDNNNYKDNIYINKNIWKQNKINNSAFHKRVNSYDDELIINIPRINNNFQPIIDNNKSYDFNNKTYIKKTISRNPKSKLYNLKSLIIPQNLNKFYPPNNIKEIKLKLNKCIKIFNKDNNKIKKLKLKNNKDNNDINSLINLEKKKYIKLFENKVPYIKKISLDVNFDFNEIESKKIKNKKLNSSYGLKNNCDNEAIAITNLLKKNSSNKNNELNKDINTDQFNLNENMNINKNRSRNKINKNNSLLYINNSLNLSNNTNEIEEIDKNTKKLNMLNNIQINDKSQDSKSNNQFLSFMNNTFDENKLYISTKSYEEFIQYIIKQTQDMNNELLKEPNINYNISKISNENFDSLNNLLSEFDKNVRLLKYSHLSLLIQKHFLKTKIEKINLIKKANIIDKREFLYKNYLNMINNLKEKLKFAKIDEKKKYINIILQILNQHKIISKFEIKYTKKIFIENKKISAEYLDFIFKQKNEENNKIKEEGKESFIKNIKNDNSGKKIAISTTVIIPILYGISYLLYYYNNNCK